MSYMKNLGVGEKVGRFPDKEQVLESRDQYHSTFPFLVFYSIVTYKYE